MSPNRIVFLLVVASFCATCLASPTSNEEKGILKEGEHQFTKFISQLTMRLN